MNVFTEFKKALKISKCIKEVKKYLNNTHITKDTKDDIEIIKNASERLSNRIPAFGELVTIIKQTLK